MSTDGTATTGSNGVTTTATGGTDGTDTVAETQYGGDPVGALTDGTNYFDVAVSAGNTFTSIVIQNCSDISTTTVLSWWDPSADSGSGGFEPVVGDPGPTYGAGPPPCLSVTLDSTTSPSIAELTGTVFGVAKSLQITTESLTGGTVHKKYTDALGATGGNPPYKWSVSSGSLPTGLKLNKSTGAISGKPKASGTSTFSVEVVDKKKKGHPSTQNTDSKVLSITVS